jgi:hypothetical protein
LGKFFFFSKGLWGQQISLEELKRKFRENNLLESSLDENSAELNQNNQEEINQQNENSPEISDGKTEEPDLNFNNNQIEERTETEEKFPRNLEEGEEDSDEDGNNLKEEKLVIEDAEEENSWKKRIQEIFDTGKRDTKKFFLEISSQFNLGRDYYTIMFLIGKKIFIFFRVSNCQ